MYYGDKQDSKVRISEALAFRGWQIHGFKEDNSNSMIDYFDFADWSGIATKNGYVLVIANAYKPGIVKTNDGLELNYQTNPKNTYWHIEKDSEIVAKGSGVFSYSRINLTRAEELTFEKYDDNMVFHYFEGRYEKDNWSTTYGYVLERHAEKAALLDRLFGLVEKWEKIISAKGSVKALEKQVVTKGVAYNIPKISTSPTSYVKLASKWRRFGGIEKGFIYKIVETDNGVVALKLSGKNVDFGGKPIATYKLEPSSKAKTLFFRGKAEDFENGDILYIDFEEKIKMENKTVYKKQVEKTTESESNSTTLNSKFEDIFKKAETKDDVDTRDNRPMKIFKIKEDLGGDFKSFLDYGKDKGYFEGYSPFKRAFYMYIA